MRKMGFRFRSFLMMSFIILLYSCKKEQADQQVLISNVSGLSITNAAIGTSSLNFFLDNQQVQLPDSLGYGSTEFFTLPNYIYSDKTPYKNIEYGYKQLGFMAPGSSNFLVSLNNYFKSGAKYSVFITDTVSHGQLRYVLLEDNFTPSDSGKAQLRFINLSPDAPAMDIWMFPNAGTDGYRLFSNRVYPSFDYSSIPEAQAFTTIPAIPYYIVATLAGTTTILLEGGLIIPSRSVVTIYAKGLVSAGGVGNNQLDVGVIEYIQ